jgi:hypothetical protein
MNINDLNMADLPDTVPFVCYVHIEPYGGTVAASNVDMAEYGYIPLGKVTVEVPVPKDGNPVEMMLEALEAEANHARAQCNQILNKVAEKKAQILALPWKSADKKEGSL